MPTTPHVTAVPSTQAPTAPQSTTQGGIQTTATLPGTTVVQPTAGPTGLPFLEKKSVVDLFEHNTVHLLCLLELPINQSVKMNMLLKSISGLTCPQPSGLFSHPTDCHKFVQCANGIPYEMNCPPTTYFNEQIQVCDHMYNAPPGCT